MSMSLNIYNEEEEQRYISEDQLNNSDRDYPQATELYYTVSQSPQQSRGSSKRSRTGQSKQIRKMKYKKNLRANIQYETEWKNFLIQKISSMDEESLYNNPQIDFSQKDLKILKKKMKRLNLQ
ncbi:unnamed protein product (macronuclear) [Paramecium tetraurelia]|uniref:Uncharacterized protein n=1 Tax=Paramecium tetraurelia TaxID=5888 RepID=A0E9I0_PARTE|nr:uncharacterized protein GSPATT00024678001 [Paramecium tetraurelia]CAK91947.1 unnamed protein product [Paramecium tetraurelia]|eukprot:XP_001459344.1 hypothetical protein (macronuclear) [Paramecium tetraurelia strain d4-2]